MAQTLEWVARVPMFTPSPMLASMNITFDRTRGVLVTVGWDVGTVLTSKDFGQSWYGPYRYITDVVKKEPGVIITDDGTWIYHGLTPWNQGITIVSENGGTSWRPLTKDRQILNESGHVGMTGFYEPNVIVAYDTLTRLMYTIDYGKTWRAMPSFTPEKIGSGYTDPRYLPNGAVYARDGNVWRRWLPGVDSGWVKTHVPGSYGVLFERGDTFIGTNFGRLVVRIGPDSVYVVTSSISVPELDTAINLKVVAVAEFSDGTIYIYDDRGLILEFNRTDGSISLKDRIALNDVFGFGSSMRSFQQFDDRVFIEFSNRPEQGARTEEKSLCYEYDHETGMRRTAQVVERFSDLLQGAGRRIYPSFSPLVYMGEHGLFMYNLSQIREVVRSTDLGRTWIHPSKISAETIPPKWLPMRNGTLQPNGEIVAQSVYDHLVVERDSQFIEIRQTGTDWKANVRDEARYDKGFRIFYPSPRVISDALGLISFVPWIVRLNPTDGSIIDTVLTRKASFMTRLSPDLLIAGRDSLWISFNNGLEWFYEDAGLGAFPDTERGGIGDVAQSPSGHLFCALRGSWIVDKSGNRTILKHGGVSISSDRGDTWKMSAGWPSNYVQVTTISALASGTLLAAACEVEIDSSLMDVFIYNKYPARIVHAGMFRSTDEGATWSKVFTDHYSGGVYLSTERSILQAANGNILASTVGGSIVVSTDDGATWSNYDLTALEDAIVYSLTSQSDGSIFTSTSIGIARLIAPGFTSVHTESQPDNALNAYFASSDMLNIECMGISGFLTVSTLDGCSAYTSKVESGTSRIHLPGLSAGLYIVAVLDLNNIASVLVLR